MKCFLVFVVSKLEHREFPHQVSQQHTLIFCKWIFSTEHVRTECSFIGVNHFVLVQEARVAQKDTVAQEIIYQQAVEDVRKKRIDVGDHSQELESLQLQEKTDEVVTIVFGVMCFIVFL